LEGNLLLFARSLFSVIASVGAATAGSSAFGCVDAQAAFCSTKNRIDADGPLPTFLPV